MIGSDILSAIVSLQSEGLFGWIVVGLAAGWIANRLMGDSALGPVGDIAGGLSGALIGGFVVALVWTGFTGVIGSLVLALVGACILIWLFGALSDDGSLHSVTA